MRGLVSTPALAAASRTPSCPLLCKQLLQKKMTALIQRTGFLVVQSKTICADSIQMQSVASRYCSGLCFFRK